MPAGLIDEKHGVCVWRDVLGDFGKMKVHRQGIADRQDKGCAFALLRTDGAEDVRRKSALIVRRARPRSALGPAARDLVLLTDAGFILEPDFYLVGLDAFFTRDFLQAGWEVFLKFSIAPCACARWRGLAESFR